MKKPLKKQKLVLSKESVRVLDLGLVGGGTPITELCYVNSAANCPIA
jgi:hypothetical protein